MTNHLNQVDDAAFMREALKEAKKARDALEVPVGAVLVYQGKIIARAHNQVELLQDATAHAEMLAMTMGASYLQNFRLDETTLYTTLEPCIMCAGAILLSRVGRLVFGAKDYRYGAHGSLIDVFESARAIHKLEIMPDVLQLECGALLTEFFKKRRESRAEDHECGEVCEREAAHSAQ